MYAQEAKSYWFNYMDFSPSDYTVGIVKFTQKLHLTCTWPPFRIEH